MQAVTPDRDCLRRLDSNYWAGSLATVLAAQLRPFHRDEERIKRAGRNELAQILLPIIARKDSQYWNSKIWMS
jgi:hypothetical protein